MDDKRRVPDRVEFGPTATVRTRSPDGAIHEEEWPIQVADGWAILSAPRDMEISEIISWDWPERPLRGDYEMTFANVDGNCEVPPDRVTAKDG